MDTSNPKTAFHFSSVIDLYGEAPFVLRRFADTIESRLLSEQEHIRARPAVLSLERLIAAPPVRHPSERTHPIEVRKEGLGDTNQARGANLHKQPMFFHPWLYERSSDQTETGICYSQSLSRGRIRGLFAGFINVRLCS